jgi:hypothetical protein
MKKIMIAFVAMLIVSSVNAASVNWTTSSMLALPSYATKWQNQTVSFYLTTAGYDLSTIITGLQANDKSVLNPQPGLALDATKALGGDPFYRAAITGTDTSFVNGNTAYGFAVVWNTGTAGVDLDFVISKVTASVVFGPAGNASLDFLGAANFTSYSVVPEPTSMALLALGIAAVGLRRRFKK